MRVSKFQNLLNSFSSSQSEDTSKITNDHLDLDNITTTTIEGPGGTRRGARKRKTVLPSSSNLNTELLDETSRNSGLPDGLEDDSEYWGGFGDFWLNFEIFSNGISRNF